MLLFVDKLINVDFSYLDEQRGLVGETWLASVELEGKLNDQGMVCDFGLVKKLIRDWLEDIIDHRLLIPANSEKFQDQGDDKDRHLIWSYNSGNTITLSAPAQALTLIPAKCITPETVASWSIAQLMPRFPSSLSSLNLQFVCEKIDGPWYHYSHGLKKHAGNCQRIAHGHRSKIEIWINGIPALNEMKLWAEKWRDIYVASEEDLLKREDGSCHFAYDAQQGHFELSLPEDAVYFIDSDSTVEFIAEHIAMEIKKIKPADKIRVKAYEGLGKGAIAEL